MRRNDLLHNKRETIHQQTKRDNQKERRGPVSHQQTDRENQQGSVIRQLIHSVREQQSSQ